MEDGYRDCGRMDSTPQIAMSLATRQLAEELEKRGMKSTGFPDDDARRLQVAFDAEFERDKALNAAQHSAMFPYRTSGIPMWVLRRAGCEIAALLLPAVRTLCFWTVTAYRRLTLYGSIGGYRSPGAL